MPAKNVDHDAVIRALVADGWTITDDPLKLEYGDRNLYVDLGAETSAVGAEKLGRKIAVEIQSFLSASPLRDLEEAVGQYQVYDAVLSETQPERQLYLAAPRRTYETVLTEKIGQLIIARLGLRLLIFDDQSGRVHRWIESIDTGRSRDR